MPILNPSIHNFLLNNENAKPSSNAINFYYRYLKIASRHIFNNLSTIEASIYFKENLKKCIAMITRKFGCTINEVDLENPAISNIYKFLYNKIGSISDKSNKKSKKVEGKYFKLTDNFETSFFKPNTFYSHRRSWVFSDIPVAILTINTTFCNDKPDFYELIKLEICLMKAAGFTLVLCANLNNFTDFILKLIQDFQFAEIHLTSKDDNNLINFFHQSSNDFSFLNGFIYIYSPYISKDSKFRKKYKECKKLPRVKFVTFSENLTESIKQPFFQLIKPFVYCKVGFKYKYLRVELSNVSLYDDEDDNNSFVPLSTSGISQCYISPSDFLNWQADRVKIIYDDVSRNRRYNKYVNFEDLHIIKKDFYVSDPLATGKIDLESIKQIDELEEKIKKKVEKRLNKKFRRDYVKSLSTEKLIQNSVKYASYAYAYHENSLNNDFSIHRSQIYTALQASESLFNAKDINIDNLIKQKKLYEDMSNIRISEIADAKIEQISKNEFSKKILNLFQEKMFDKPTEIDLSIFDQMFNRFFHKPTNYFTEIIKKNPHDLLKIAYALGEIAKDEFLNVKLESIDEQIQENIDKYQKGVVYQVDTGEGKSCIICLIAAILALNGKKVHICSSNYKLANRDYMDSFEFFRQLKLKSAVLVHDNELPVPPRKKKKRKSLFKKEQNEQKEEIKEETKIKPNSSDFSENQNNNDSQLKDSNNEPNDLFFKDNLENYFETNTHDDKAAYAKYYYNDNDYYDEEQFYNSSKMNFAVCGFSSDDEIIRDAPKIIFSTFVNFECFYLKMLELSPGYIDDYYKNAALLIDEADSILIDEITNGTIVSRDVNSNCKPILKFVYDQYGNNISTEDTFKEIKKKWPECTDLKLKDVELMYKDIDTINKPEFENGKKYSIEEYKVKNNKEKEKLLKEALNVTKNIALGIGKGIFNLLRSVGKEEEDNNDDKDEDDDDDDDDDEDEEEDDDEGPETIFRHVVPFDYDHKGILEPNKEFGGFIQQFIAIKESKNYKNMIIKDMSLNYLYVSHPIFVKLYNRVCGFTGTIGGKKEKEIYKKEYNLETVKIPRNKANKRVELPMILCNSIDERNKIILFEILQFHNQGNPVLVIFQDLKEINAVAKMIYDFGIKYINIFDGKEDIIRPDRIAGINGAITLGTNFCGRGTNIIAFDKPLHVIISYYSSNNRVMDQAKGRTARQGQKGTIRIICLKNQFLFPKILYDDEMKNIIDEFSIKDKIQTKYISHFQSRRPWVFSNDIDKQDFSKEEIIQLREARINVNRTVAYNFKFPLKMSVDTFLDIQSQKIFSIFNCPNSKYTWRLFQKYVREMIFESWSLTINKADEEFFSKKENKEYKNEVDELNYLNIRMKFFDEYRKRRLKLNEKYSKNIKEYEVILKKSKIILLKKINQYLPSYNKEIVPTFLRLFDIVVKKYEDQILSSFDKLPNAYLHHNKSEYISIQVGFKPYSLLTESGARITYKNFKKTNYIKDPELKYMKKTPKNRICLLSITEKIDDIFNKIFQKINSILGEKTFLKFFMRRTLIGCEFGICLDFPMYTQENYDPNCIVDRDPLLIFTISVKSIIPVLAGVLIILLVYVASIAKDIGKWFTCLPAQMTKEFAMKVVGIVISTVSKELFHYGLDKVIEFLRNTLKKQLTKLKSINNEKAQNAADIIESIKKLFSSKIGQKINKKFSSFLGDKIKVTLDWHKLLKECLDPERMMTISFYIILCIATFIMNFSCGKKAVEQSQEDSKEYENSFKTSVFSKKETRNKKKTEAAINTIWKRDEQKLDQKLNEELKELDDDDYDDIEEKYYEEEESDERLKKFTPEEKYELERQMTTIINQIEGKYLYKYHSYKPTKIIKKITDFVVKNDSALVSFSNRIADISEVIQKGAFNHVFLRMHYEGILKKVFIRQVRIYATNEFPSILKIANYSINKKNYNLYFENSIVGSLANQLNFILDQTKRFIIAYGIASAMRYLHSHHIVHNNLNTSSILLDSSLHPYLSEFHNARLIKEYEKNQNKFASDVFTFGLILFIIVTRKDPFTGLKPEEILLKINNISENSFPKGTNNEWIKLITICWCPDPSDRPSFNEICDILESMPSDDPSLNTKDIKKYKKKFKKYKIEYEEDPIMRKNYKLRRTNVLNNIDAFDDYWDNIITLDP